MSKTVIRAAKYLGHRDAMLFLRQTLNKYNLNQLSEIKLRHVGYTSSRPFPNCYGNTKRPFPLAKTEKARNTYRISASIRGYDNDMPYEGFAKHVVKMPRKYKWSKPAGMRYNSIEELMVFIIGHEIYHYLCWTKQLSTSVDDEVRADEMGDAWVKEYREWKNLYRMD